jgi:hypothetical protein
VSGTLTYHEFYEYVGKVEERLLKRIEGIATRLLALEGMGPDSPMDVRLEAMNKLRAIYGHPPLPAGPPRKTPEEVAEEFRNKYIIRKGQMIHFEEMTTQECIAAVADLIRRDRRGET